MNDINIKKHLTKMLFFEKSNIWKFLSGYFFTMCHSVKSTHIWTLSKSISCSTLVISWIQYHKYCGPLYLKNNWVSKLVAKQEWIEMPWVLSVNDETLWMIYDHLINLQSISLNWLQNWTAECPIHKYYCRQFSWCFQVLEDQLWVSRNTMSSERQNSLNDSR